jgi:hypothetical protein
MQDKCSSSGQTLLSTSVMKCWQKSKVVVDYKGDPLFSTFLIMNIKQSLFVNINNSSRGYVHKYKNFGNEVHECPQSVSCHSQYILSSTRETLRT